MNNADKPARVLVTGGTGFIGGTLLRQIPSGWDVVALARTPFDLPGAEVVPFPNADTRLPAQLESEFDAVLYLAGNANHGLAESRPWEDLTATGVTAAQVLGRIRARRVVLLSSAAVYAGLAGPVRPDLCLRPLMAYALSKLYVEGLVASLAASGRIESSLIVRLYNAFGPGERTTRLIPRVAASLMARETFVLTGDPGSLSDPVHVDDVANALLAAVLSPATGVFDLCGGDPVPLEVQVGRIAQAMGWPAPTVTVLPRSGEVPIAFFSDPGPIQAALKVPPPVPFARAVRAYAEVSGWMPRP